MGANFNFNKVIIGGRLTSDPELKQTQSGIAVATFSVAVNRKAKQGESDFFNVTAWRQTAELIARYFHKGSSICIVGSLQNSSWTDQNKQKHYRTDIVADEVNFVDSKSDDAQPSYGQQTAPKFEEIKTDDNLPF
jgi:single-strand DNA-binding protein